MEENKLQCRETVCVLDMVVAPRTISHVGLLLRVNVD